MCKLAEKDESKKKKADDIDDHTKEVEINENGEVLEADNDKLVVNDANNNPPPQDTLTTTTTMATAAEEGMGDNDVGAEDGDNYDYEADYTKGGKEGEAIPR